MDVLPFVTLSITQAKVFGPVWALSLPIGDRLATMNWSIRYRTVIDGGAENPDKWLSSGGCVRLALPVAQLVERLCWALGR